MPEKEGTIFAKSEHGIKFQVDGPWFNKALAHQREEPWQWEEMEKGNRIKIVYSDTDKDGRTYHNVHSIEILRPETEPEGELRASQFRSPLDFRRTSALAQAVIHLSQPSHSEVTAVLNLAAQFEKYLEGGYGGWVKMLKGSAEAEAEYIEVHGESEIPYE